MIGSGTLFFILPSFLAALLNFQSQHPIKEFYQWDNDPGSSVSNRLFPDACKQMPGGTFYSHHKGLHITLGHFGINESAPHIR